MDPVLILYIAGLVFAVAMTLWGLLSKRRSFLVGIAALVVTIMAGLAAWHAFASVRSLPWTIGYAVAAGFALLSAIRQFNPAG